MSLKKKQLLALECVSAKSESEQNNSTPDDSDLEDIDCLLGKRGRKENGLVDLTKNLINLLRSAPNQTLDLNDAVFSL